LSVHETKSGKWEVRYREGKRNRGKVFDRKTDASAFEVAVKAKRQRGEPIIRLKDTPFLDELAERWMEMRSAEGIARSTAQFNVAVLEKHISPVFGHLRVAEIDAVRIDEWRRRSTASAYMMNRSQELLGQLLAYAKQLGYIENNPSRDLKRLAHRTRKGKAASPEQVEAMRDWLIAKDRRGYATLISVLAYVGVRPAEALSLRWDSLQSRRLFIASHAANGEIAEGTKTKVNRYPEVPAPVLADLAQWRLTGGSSEGLIFPRSDGMAWRKTDWDNWRARWFRPAAGAAGLLEWDERAERWAGDFRPYDLRHTCASLMIHSLAPPGEIAAHMGHGLQVLFSTYGHDIEQMRGEQPQPIERAIQAARGVRHMFAEEAG
jgi:integrase